MHPPTVVFLLLFTFSCGAAFLAGFSMTTNSRSWFHMFALALAVTLTVYATLEIEYPRQGLIRLNHTDDTLIALRNSMN
jgi:lipoprotein signal peptidase